MQPYVVNQQYVPDQAMEVFVVDDSAKIWKKITTLVLATVILALIGATLLCVATGLAAWSYQSGATWGSYIGMWTSRINGVQYDTPPHPTRGCFRLFTGAKWNSLFAAVNAGVTLLAAVALLAVTVLKKKFGRQVALGVAAAAVAAFITAVLSFSFYATWASSTDCGNFRHYSSSFIIEVVGAFFILCAVAPAFLVWKSWPIFIVQEEPVEFPVEYKGYPAPPTYTVADPSYAMAATYTVPSQGATFAPAGQSTYVM